MKLENFSTGAPPSDDIPIERNPVCGAGDGVVVLEDSAYSLSTTDLPPALVSQPPTAATDEDGQQK